MTIGIEYHTDLGMILVGFQGAGTQGRELLDKASQITTNTLKRQLKK